MRLLLVLDQMEELWTDRRCTAEDRESLLSAIEALARSGRAWVLATLRSDFYPQAQQSDAFLRLKGAGGQYDLRAPGAAALARVIVEPARLAGLGFERDEATGRSLDQQILEDAVRQPEALPLLQYALRELYEGCDGGSLLSFSAYEALGGVEGALGRRAEAVFSALPEESRAAFGEVFRSLVTVDAAGEGAGLRRRAPLAPLVAEPAHRALVDALIAHRFLTADRAGDLPVVALTHEALLRRWERLASWVASNREYLRLCARVEQDQARWEQGHEDPSLLLPAGLPLAEGRTLLSAAPGLLSSDTVRFIASSLAAEDHRVARERSQQEERVRLLRNRSIAAIVASVLAMIVVAVTLVAIKVNQDRGAERLAKTRLLQDASLDRERLGDNGTGAVLLGKALVEAADQNKELGDALRVAITLARGRLLPLRNILDVTGDARGCAVSPDGRLAIVGTSKGRVWYADLARSQLTATPASAGEVFYRTGDDARLDSVSAVAFEPLGTRFAAATVGGTIHVVDTAAGGAVRKIAHPGQPMTVDFSPDGHSLLVAGFRDEKRHSKPIVMAIYDVESGACTRAFSLDHELYAAAFSPDGRWAVAGGGIPPHPRLEAWDLKAPGITRRTLAQSARVFALSFRPGHGARLVAGDVNGHVQFWNLAKGVGAEADGPEILHEKQVRVVSFSEDGRLLLVGGEDGTAQLWDVEARIPFGQRLMHRGQVRGGTISRNAERVVTASFAGDIRVWDLRPAAAGGQVFPHPGPVWDATFDDTGDRILTGCPADGDAPGAGWVWNLADGKPIPLRHGADVMVARFRPNSADEAVTCGNDGSVYFWDTRTGQRMGTPLSHEAQMVYTAAFDVTGSRFAFAGRGNVIRICDFDTLAGGFRVTQRLEHPAFSFVWALHFGPKEGQLFSDGGPRVRGWALGKGDTPTFRDLIPPRENQSIEEKVEVRLGGFDRTGRRVLTIGTDGAIAVWDLENLASPPRFLRDGRGDNPHGPGQSCADWDHTQDVIATGGPDGVVRLWRPDGSRWSEQDLRHPSSIEVLAFSPDGNWLATGCRDGGLRLWSVAKGIWTGAGWYHAGPVTRVQFSRDGRRLLSASRDRTARVVEIPSPTVGTPKQILAELEADAGILVAVEGTGMTSSVTAPQALTSKTFGERRRPSKSPR